MGLYRLVRHKPRYQERECEGGLDASGDEKCGRVLAASPRFPAPITE